MFHGKIFFLILFRGEDDHVIFKDESLKEFPELLIGISEIYVAPPNPRLSFPVELYEGKGLRVMDNDTILFYLAIRGKGLIGSNIELFFYVTEVY